MCLTVIGHLDFNRCRLTSRDVNVVAYRNLDVRIVKLHRRVVEDCAWVVVLGDPFSLIGTTGLAASGAEYGAPCSW